MITQIEEDFTTLILVECSVLCNITAFKIISYIGQFILSVALPIGVTEVSPTNLALLGASARSEWLPFFINYFM